VEGINILIIWIRCANCIYSKIENTNPASDEYFKCTHGWHRTMQGNNQRLNRSRKCRQHRKRRLILKNEELVMKKK